MVKDDNIKLSYFHIIKTVKDFLEDNNISTQHMNILLYNKKVILPSENLTTYQTKFNKYKFRFYNSKFNNLTFIENDNKVQNLNNNQINKLQKEFKILKNSIMLSNDASIFFMIEKDNIQNMRFIISGPKNTPYEYGLFIFNMTIPTDYPNKPPFVKLSNTDYILSFSCCYIT